MRFSVLNRALRDRRRSMIWWSVGVAAYVVMIVSVFPTVRDTSGMQDLMSQYPKSVLAMMGNTEPLKAAAQGDVWVVYPMNPAPGQRWVPWAWLAVGMVGTLIQMYVTGGERGRIKAKKKPKE